MNRGWRLVVALGLGIAAGALPVAAQSSSAGLPFEAVVLDDLSAFRAPTGSWRVVGDVVAERARQHHLQPVAGTGVLVNLPGRGRGEDLLTEWEHGDIELDLEFLVPQGSNSGIYLQGRYELQILDSWGVRNPTFGDVGGIYERWDESRPEGQRGYEGHAPRVNAGRAPGLWQSLQVLFRAPRFDAAGNKVANARFVRVVLNGAVIHENVELSGPTRGALAADERPTGPLRLQGDHGPVALRNVRYKLYTGEQLGIAELRYRAYHGEFGSLAEATRGEPAHEGEAAAISSEPAGANDQFALHFAGTLEVPVSGHYQFELGLDWVTDDPHFTDRAVGGALLAIGGREVLTHAGLEASTGGGIHLEAGRHPFTLAYYKNRPWISQRYGISLVAEGPGIERHSLYEVGATAAAPPELIAVEPGSEAVVLRSFVEHAGAVRTHVLSVADPAGVHYSYDLAQGALLYAWRGPFVETTDMWHSRGERQLAQPQGSVLPVSTTPLLAILHDAAYAWPDSVASDQDFRFDGYSLDEAGRPTFHYRLGGVQVDERIRPAEDGRALRRELALTGQPAGGTLYARLAEGERMQRLRDGSYAVGDRTYYVALERGAPRPVVRDRNGRQELLLPVQLRSGAATIAYTIIW